METQVRSMKDWRLLLMLGLLVVAPILAPQPAGVADCPAPGTGYAGAKNMVNDATMLAIPMTRDAPQGNAGMHTAVVNSACDAR